MRANSIRFTFVEKFPDDHLDVALRAFGYFFLGDVNNLCISASGTFNFYRFQLFSHPVLLPGVGVVDAIAVIGLSADPIAY